MDCYLGDPAVPGRDFWAPSRRAPVLLAAAPLLLLLGSVAQAGSPAIQFQGDPGSPEFGTLLVSGLDRRALVILRESSPDAALWSRLFPVFTGESLPAAEAQPPILGDWSIEADVIRFTPRYPLATGLRFFARFDGTLFDELTGSTEAGTPVLDLTFAMPDPGLAPSTHVVALYPSGGIVPENLLRLYIYFSAPIRDQSLQGMVKLFDDQGSEVETAFVEVRRGLWDLDQRRLTLIFHPGRLKRGVGPHEVMGPPLREGRSFRLEVSAGLVDAQGFRLRESFEKLYRVGAADRASPDPATWGLAPPWGSRAPLRLDLPEAMDHALMLRLITVENEGGDVVRGEAALGGEERLWSFTPADEWRPGRYAVVIHPALEDLAGNTPFRLFDEETAAAGRSDAADPAPIRLHFTVEPRG